MVRTTRLVLSRSRKTAIPCFRLRDLITCQKHSSLCSLLARAQAGLKQPATSFPLFIPKHKNKKISLTSRLLFLLNGGNCASRYEQIALAICEFHEDESSKKVIYLLEHWYAKKTRYRRKFKNFVGCQ